MRSHKFSLGAVAASLAAALVCVSPARAKDVVDYVNPYIGNVSHLLVPTFATVQLPGSMMRIYPSRGDYTSELLDGLPVLVTNHRERSAFCISVTQGDDLRPVVRSTWDQERITPYGFDVEIADNTIGVQLAVSHQSAIYTFTFRDTTRPATLIIRSENGRMTLRDGRAEGHQRISHNMRAYFFGELDTQAQQAGALRDGVVTGDQEAEGRNACVAYRFPAGTRQVQLRYGISFISEQQARRNLTRDQQGFDQGRVRAEGRRIWNEALGKIQVKGGSEDEKTVLYTSFYRTMERPVCLSEDGRYFSGFDGKVHDDEGVPFYTDDWIWDTYRAAHPLRALIRPTEEEHIIASYLRMAEQMGTKWMPTFPEMTGDTRRMNSNHGVAMVADAMWKGLQVDGEKALEYCQKGMEEKTLAPWSGEKAGWIDDFYKEHGYIPALREGEEETDPNVSDFEKRQPIAVTLGTAYDY
ncbi:MAG: glycoside hydrolase family 92 protein, partial [Bacteroidaceae bacterium]|nr:glycoside hydrolase family 92 protein [Bacteroidaceae bacterium]